MDGKGVPNLFPSLAGSSNVRSTDPASLIRIVLEGARSVATAVEPTSPGVQSFAWKLNDDQLATVLTYTPTLGVRRHQRSTPKRSIGLAHCWRARSDRQEMWARAEDRICAELR
jgi:hypothetical protein